MIDSCKQDRMTATEVIARRIDMYDYIMPLEFTWCSKCGLVMRVGPDDFWCASCIYWGKEECFDWSDDQKKQYDINVFHDGCRHEEAMVRSSETAGKRYEDGLKPKFWMHVSRNEQTTKLQPDVGNRESEGQGL